jgi:hypothetical protein
VNNDGGPSGRRFNHSALWLFGFDLLGLIGFARQNKDGDPKAAAFK